jgi:hypothetical protein
MFYKFPTSTNNLKMNRSKFSKQILKSARPGSMGPTDIANLPSNIGSVWLGCGCKKSYCRMWSVKKAVVGCELLKS